MKAMGMMVVLSVLLLSTACGSNEKSAAAEAMQTKNASSTVASAIVANQSATFTVTGLECCPPSVIVDLISKVTGVSKVNIEPLGSKGSFV